MDIKRSGHGRASVCYVVNLWHIVRFGLCKFCSSIHAVQHRRAFIIQAETTDVVTKRCININHSLPPQTVFLGVLTFGKIFGFHDTNDCLNMMHSLCSITCDTLA